MGSFNVYDILSKDTHLVVKIYTQRIDKKMLPSVHA